MNKTIGIIVAVFLSAFLATQSLVYAFNPNDLSPTQRQAFDEIAEAIDKTVEGNWTDIDIFGLSRFNDRNDTGTEIIVNNSGPVVPLPPQCPEDTHLDNGLCEPNEPPVVNDTDPIPDNDTGTTPNASRTVEVLLVGDLDNKKVLGAVTNANADYCFFLGDLEYSDFEAFEDYLDICSNVKWVVGNHDDDSKFNAMETWNVKVGKVLFIGFSTEGNYEVQRDKVSGYFNNSTLMKDVTSVHLLSHKPTAQPHPDAHHGLETGARDFGTFVESLLPEGVIYYKEWGHNHDFAESADGTLKEIGTGGRDFYECGINAIWVTCINDEFGYYKFTIDLDTGELKGNFYGVNGEVIH